MCSNLTCFQINLNNATFIIDEEDGARSLDDVRDSSYILIPITVLYLMIFACSLIGNISTCIVIFHNRYMHTATNYYLFSLAISDLLLVLTGLPKEVYELWFRYMYIFGEPTCVLQGFASETAANATVLTITAFTVERYVAICYPFFSHTVSKLSRALKHIIIIWILALCLAIPQAIQFGVLYYVSPNNSSQRVECTVKSEEINAFVISSLVFFVVPICVISVLYILIGLQLRSSRLMNIKQSSISSGGTIDRQNRQNQTRVIRMLVAVVVAFIICWAPFHGQRLLALYAKSATNLTADSWLVQLYISLTYISGIFYFLSTTVNPILYNIMSHRFRHAFKITFQNLCGCGSSEKYNTTMIRSRCIRSNQYRVPSTPRSSESLPHEEIPLYTSKLVNNSFIIRQDSKPDIVIDPEIQECLNRNSSHLKRLISISSDTSNTDININYNSNNNNNNNNFNNNNNNNKNKNNSNHNIKKERSPIMVIKAQLHNLNISKSCKNIGNSIKKPSSVERLLCPNILNISNIEIVSDGKCNTIH